MPGVQPRSVWSSVTQGLLVRYRGPYGDRYLLDRDAARRLVAGGMVR